MPMRYIRAKLPRFVCVLLDLFFRHPRRIAIARSGNYAQTNGVARILRSSRSMVKVRAKERNQGREIYS